MKFLVQHLYILKKILKNIVILLIFYDQIKQHNLANIQNNHNIQKPIINNQINKKKNDNATIDIQSNQAKFYLSNNMLHFSENVIITYNKRTLYANEIYLYRKKNYKEKTYTFLSGTGNIHYNDNLVNITGKKIIIDIQNKNVDLYQGKLSFKKKQKIIHGEANCIKQRKNDHYTILKNSDFTFCPSDKKHWHISSSQVLFDHKKGNLNIWNAYFKIKKIPILYIPYIQLPVSQKNNLKYHSDIQQYNNLHGIEIKLPYYFNINNNFYGNITTNLIPQKGIQFQNSIQYFNKLNENSINFNLLNNKKLHKNYWLLYLYNNNHIREKWHIKNECIKISDHNYFHNAESKHINIEDNYYIKKNISWAYTDTIWNINLIYKEFTSFNRDVQNIYNTKPQININSHLNKFKLLNYHLFSQITYFTNTNHNYPKTIRLHIEPTINLSSNILYTNFNTEIKFKNTYYQQKNINFYNEINKKNEKNIHLKESVNRYLPEFKSNIKLTLHKKTNIHKYKQILEPQIQYLYIPYRNQNNIGIYDTTILEITECTNLFKDTIYSGLDRITSANQLTSAISTKIYNNNNIELLHVSLGQIYCFTQQNIGNYTKKINVYKNKDNNITWGMNTYWKINQTVGIRNNLQYNTQIKKLKSGNAIIEHRTKNNKILQINIRYLNSQYFTQIIPEETNPIYKKNITQIGIIGNLPINTHWTFSGTQFYNVKNKYTINQIIGIQYRTCCWKVNAGYERKISYSNNITIKKYNNKLLLHLTLSGINQNTQSQICNILHTNALPYQSIL